MNNEENLPLLGAIYIILGVLDLLVAVVFFAVIGFRVVVSGDALAVIDATTKDARLMIVPLTLPAGLLALIGGIGLRKRKSWAWGLVWALACMGLLSVPVGTAVGAYALWVLTRSEVRQALGVDTGPAAMRAIRIMAAIALLLIIVSYPACHFTEPIIEAELSKLSPEETQVRLFDMEFMR